MIMEINTDASLVVNSAWRVKQKIMQIKQNDMTIKSNVRFM
jgi:hypothetical protein